MTKTYALKGLDCPNCAAKEGDPPEGNEGKWEIARLIAGAVIFAAGIIIDHVSAFELHPYALLAVFIAAYLVLGGNVVLRALKNIVRGQVFDENFLMSVATIGAFIIGEYPEAVGVMLFYQVGEMFQEMAVRKSKKSITALMDIRPDFANLKVNGELQRVTPEAVKIGDIIVVKPGEKIPLDGVIIEGESMLDTKALTGESVPRSAKPSDAALSGCINLNGVLTIKVSKVFGESTVAKIIALVENASDKKAPAENFITTFSRYYTPAVVGLAMLLAVLPPLLFGGEWADWVHRVLVFLVISCPCALVISIPLGFFSGIGAASKRGVLVKGGNYLEALNSLDVIVFDKTGTLTKGVFNVTGLHPAQGFSEGSLLECAAKAETFSNHPIALSILKAYGKDIEKGGLADYKEIAGQGTLVTSNGIRILAGNGKLMEKEGILFAENTATGTRVYVAANGKYAGCIVISDEVKPDSHSAIAGLKKQGITKTVMLTGDDRTIAAVIAKELAIDEVHAQLLPGEKVAKVEELLAQQRPGKKLAFAGDGINDAPVLARADVGIAMGALGSDAAIEAADVVLMTDELSRLVDAIRIAKRTKRIVVQNIVFALGVKGIFLALGALGVAGMWEAVFADTGIALLAVLNALRIMYGVRR